MPRRANTTANIIAIIVLIIGVLAAFLVFYSSNASRIKSQNENYLEDFTVQRAHLINDLFVENLRYIESSSILVETEFQNQGLNMDSINVPDEADIDPAAIASISEVLNVFENRYSFDYFRFIDLYGRDYTTDSEKVIQAVVAEREYYKQGIAGKTGMTYVLDSKVTSERQIGFYSPVIINGQIAGMVVGFFGEDFIHELLDVHMFDYECEAVLCDRDGTIVFNTDATEQYSNFLDKAHEASFADENNREKIAAAFQEASNQGYSYFDKGKDSIGQIAYVSESSDLFLVMDFPVQAYQDMLRNSNLNGAMLLGILIVLFVGAAVLYLMRFLAQRKQLIAEAKNSNDIHFAMSRLFENFVIVDVPTRMYNYIEGMPDVDKIPHVGAYDLFAADLLNRFPVDDERSEAAGLIEFDRLINAMNAGANVVSYNFRAPIREEEWFTYNFIVVSRDERGKVTEFIIARQDITTLQKKEEETRLILEQARDEAEKGNRAKSDFLSSMSHDIRTPMNAIIGYTNIARDHMDDSTMVRDSLNKIASSSQYLLSLINDILDMSKIESGKIQLNISECNLADAFERIADLTRSQSEKKNLDVHFDIDGLKHKHVKVDELRLEQIMVNITSNAVKYTPADNSIYISAFEDEALDDTHARYRFVVRDTGIGMSEDYLPHIFESFSREQASTISTIQGTGLGMAITSRLVNMMGGEISVKSKLGEGSEFTVVLGLETYEPSPDGEGIAGKGDGRTIDIAGSRVLLVEDNDINADIATLVLEQYGVETERAANGQMGFEMVRDAEPGYYAAVLMDIQMPVMNGYDATRAIRALGGHATQLPIIAMSANAYEEDIRDSLDSGMNRHIAKPFDPDELARVLDDQINGV